jgi:hypothetical protein
MEKGMMRRERTQVAAQTGVEASDDRLHAVLEFCIIALHITVVVKRAYRLVVFVRLIFPHPRRF